MKRPKTRVIIPDEAMRDVPPEERAEVRRYIEQMFASYDPQNPPGRPVDRVACLPRLCRACGSNLLVRERATHTADGLCSIADCENPRCSQSYLFPALS